jgi:hypothetical protein
MNNLKLLYVGRVLVNLLFFAIGIILGIIIGQMLFYWGIITFMDHTTINNVILDLNETQLVDLTLERIKQS